jgi:Putative metallopeptidase
MRYRNMLPNAGIGWGVARRFELVALIAVLIAAFLGLLLTESTCSIAAESKAQQIKIDYGQPRNAKLEPVYEELKRQRVLEYVQDLLGPFKLPRPLTVKLADCSGISNAAYGKDAVIVCYEYIADILKNAAKEHPPIGISDKDTVIGPLVDVFLHESGHAIFDYLRVPLFGNEEDAADQFSAFIMLQFDKERARRLILGSAYQYRLGVKDPKLTLATSAFADVHGQPAERFFNVLCMAYGADPQLFADLVTKAYLPRNRAKSCSREYAQVRFAFETLIGPHLDKQLAREALEKRGRR